MPISPANSARSTRMRRAQRVEAILNELGQNGNVHVGDLSERFGVSEATLRRDLTLLEEQDLLTRTHGGALAQHVGFALPQRQRELPASDALRAVSQLAADALPTGPQVAAFTGGDITSEVARLVMSRPELTIVTTALNIAMDVAARGTAKLMVVGGVSRPGSFELSGPWAEQIAGSLRIGTLFVQGEGIDAEGGLTSSEESYARTVQVLVARAQRVVVVALGCAVGHVALTRIAGLGDVHEVITQAQADATGLAAIQEAGVLVRLTA